MCASSKPKWGITGCQTATVLQGIYVDLQLGVQQELNGAL